MRSRTVNIGSLELRFHWLVCLCVLITIAGLVRLGLWQLDRAQEKIAEQETYTALGNQKATPISRVPTAGLEFDRQQHQNRHVVLDGEYFNERSVFLIYQTFEGQPGYEVITPFRLVDLDLLVLVSRGWSGINAYEDLAAALPRIEGRLQLEGQIYVPTEREATERNPPHTERWPLLLRYLNLAELDGYFDSPLFPYVVRLDEKQAGVLVRHWPAVSVDTSRHFSYALQWFAMAIAVAIVSLVLCSNVGALMRSGPGPR